MCEAEILTFLHGTVVPIFILVRFFPRFTLRGLAVKGPAFDFFREVKRRRYMILALVPS